MIEARAEGKTGVISVIKISVIKISVSCMIPVIFSLLSFNVRVCYAIYLIVLF